MAEKDNLVRFDWAVKRLLCQKSNFVVLEGLLSTLLGESIHIVRLLESEGNKKDADDLFPEYYILRVDDFDQKAITPLDEWIAFLKTGQIGEHPHAEGLAEARERLRVDRLTPAERKSYYNHMEALRYQRSVITTGIIEGREEGRAKGRAEGLEEGRAEGLEEGRTEGLKVGRTEGLKEGKAEGLKKGKAEGLKKGKMEGQQEEKYRIARQLKTMGLSYEQIRTATGLSAEEMEMLK